MYNPLRLRLTDGLASSGGTTPSSSVTSTSASLAREDALRLMLHGLKACLKKVAGSDPKLAGVWKEVERSDQATVFASAEGARTEAVKEGDWARLDEVSMASQETLLRGAHPRCGKYHL